MDVGAQQLSITASLSNGGAPAPTGPAAAESDARVSSQSQASPASDASATTKPLRRRNKPSLSCETCTVSRLACPMNLDTAPNAEYRRKRQRLDRKKKALVLRKGLHHSLTEERNQSSVTEADRRMSNTLISTYEA